MAELKTKVNEQNVHDYLQTVTDETKRKDCQTISKLMQEITNVNPKMWGDAIVGFGEYQYTYSTGKTAMWFIMGFAPRKANISLYIMGCDGAKKEELLSRLGKHKSGKGCVYINKLTDINFDVLKEMCVVSYQSLK